MKILVEKVNLAVGDYVVDGGAIPRQRVSEGVMIRSRMYEVIDKCLYCSHAGDCASIKQVSLLGRVIYLILRIQKRVWWGLRTHHGQVESKV
jgi:hypothetical protein